MPLTLTFWRRQHYFTLPPLRQNDIEAHTKCTGTTECKVHILLFIDIVTVTKLPANLSKSTGENTHVQSVEGIIHFEMVSQNIWELHIMMWKIVWLHVLYVITGL